MSKSKTYYMNDGGKIREPKVNAKQDPKTYQADVKKMLTKPKK